MSRLGPWSRQITGPAAPPSNVNHDGRRRARAPSALAERYNEALLEAARLFEERNDLLAALKRATSLCACGMLGGCPRCNADKALIARIEGTR